MIAPNLWAHEPDVFFNISKYWKTIQTYFSSLFAWGGLDEVMAEEMTVLPGMDELGNLLWIADHVDRGTYDLIVVDAAPTGETLRLLSLPEASRWWIERIAPIGTARPAPGRARSSDASSACRCPDEAVYEAAEALLDRLRHVHGCCPTPDNASVRLVINLEKVAIQEAQRSFTYFHLYGYPSDLIVANRCPAGRRRTLLRRLARSAGTLPADGAGCLRSGPCPHRAVLRQGDGRRGAPGRAGRRTVW